MNFDASVVATIIAAFVGGIFGIVGTLLASRQRDGGSNISLQRKKIEDIEDIVVVITQSLQVQRTVTLFILHFQWITTLEERSWNLPGISLRKS